MFWIFLHLVLEQTRALRVSLRQVSSLENFENQSLFFTFTVFRCHLVWIQKTAALESFTSLNKSFFSTDEEHFLLLQVIEDYLARRYAGADADSVMCIRSLLSHWIQVCSAFEQNKSATIAAFGDHIKHVRYITELELNMTRADGTSREIASSAHSVLTLSSLGRQICLRVPFDSPIHFPRWLGSVSGVNVLHTSLPLSGHLSSILGFP